MYGRWDVGFAGKKAAITHTATNRWEREAPVEPLGAPSIKILRLNPAHDALS